MESTNKKLRDAFGGRYRLEYVDEWIAEQAQRSAKMVQEGKAMSPSDATRRGAPRVGILWHAH